MKSVHIGILAAVALLAPPADGQTLKATPASLNYTYTLGSATFPAAQTLAVAPASGPAVTFTAAITGAPWLTVTPDSAKTNASLKVSVNPTSLAVGTYTTIIMLTPTGGTTLNVAVTLSVKAPPATLVVTPSPVTLTYTRGDPAPSPVALSLSGGGALLSFTVTISGASWLKATPKSGIIFPAFSSQVALTVDPTGLTPGTYKGSIKIDAPTAANKTQTVSFELTVNPGAPALNAIFPAGATQGSAATTITLTGSNFYSASTVTANGQTLSSTLLGPTVLQASIPPSLMASAGTLNIAVTNPNPGGGVSTDATFTVYSPGPRITGITNGASFQSGSIAPGEFVSIFGTGLGPDSIVTFQPPVGATPIASTLAGVQVFFGAAPAPLVFVSSTQIAAMVPYDVVGPGLNVLVDYNGTSSWVYPVSVAPTAPGLFALGSSGTGAGAVFNENASTGELTLNTETNAALKGTTIWLYTTGIGATTPAGVDGEIVTAESNLTAPTATLNIGGTDVTPAYFGPAPGLVSGLMLIKAAVPSTIPSGKAVPVLLTLGLVTSQVGVTVTVK
ncbi:IPT/TIG domain-containing protein [uncultured Paludibaculum sp.]|uniref:BACON domain-containing protein n=1 Tax=uncultured Paludibaculum sp. TaxID=1765020 RepID=UPI002AAC47E3|nr:IPT/TIG domain-containing protein [uncultured Paludibaculum sp.]